MEVTITLRNIRDVSQHNTPAYGFYPKCEAKAIKQGAKEKALHPGEKRSPRGLTYY